MSLIDDVLICTQRMNPVTDASLSSPQSVDRQYKYLKPSVFWSIRQGFPRRLSALIVMISLAVPLLLWSLISYAQVVPPMFLPTPTAVVQSGIEMFINNDLISDVLTSCGRVLAGFVVAALIGVPMGIAMGTFYSMESLFAPFVGTVRYMPVTAFVPLIVIWLGLGEESKILIITLGVVLYNAIMIADAVKFIPSEMINVAYTLGATRRDVLFRVIVPATFPSVLDTLRVNISGAWNYLVIAELVAAQTGIGFRIIQAQRYLQTEKVLFCILLIGLIGLAIDYGLKWMSAVLTPWADQTRH
ncbi:MULTISPECIES: ABC transporter permease [Leptolyngbya]|jgi:NitT/TauT family transport system permease protein|uniref:ABC-type nitrate/sulfonate/bicarbonate transport system, permease component n=3 Tax=Leptolyngbya group TaxID=3081713 RepID=A0A1Z4JN47_LEPBY|nr:MULTISPECIES: ABC transporter permease [Leptolyngbya]MCY6489815.1 ABC transporter permease [Leptolyngbya sp. GGD]ULP29221.1 ABC transporter permease [Leptolyngbya boryana IU 594]WNZ47587.1 ABC transporter permease [Leptolyngbya boryana CZ1]BAY58130.1 ABC-type nitrate/sulfonate/bicarbonate transport system, permease component [Leptolyngbya boryana NIES-2135]